MNKLGDILFGISKRNLLTLLARGVLFVFVTNTAFAYRPEENIWKDRTTQLASLPTAYQPNPFQKFSRPQLGQELIKQTPSLTISVNDATKTLIQKKRQSQPQIVSNLPDTFFTHVNIRDSYKGTSPSSVVLLEDVHLNKEAQTHLSDSIKSFGEIPGNRPIMVGLEGAEGKLLYEAYKKFSNREIATQVADAFFASGEISGPAHAGFTSYKKEGTRGLNFIGIDKSELYNANVQAYKDSKSLKPKVLTALAKLNRQTEKEKSKIYNARLMDFDSKVQSYREGKLKLADYVLTLSEFLPVSHNGEARRGIDKASIGSPINTPPYLPTGRRGEETVSLSFNVQTFLEAYAMESSFNFDVVEAERRTVLEKLVTTMQGKEIEELVQFSLAYQQGSVTFAEYYNHLRDVCRQNGINLAQTPHFDKYIQYVLLTDGIKTESLFKEITQLEKSVYSKLATDVSQQTLIQQDRELYLTGQLIEFSLTSDQWEEYKNIKNSDQSSGYREQSSMNSDPRSLNSKLKPFKNFYQLADDRSKAMVANLKFQVSDLSVLVAGGFHTEGLTSLLRKQGISYIVASPKITKIDFQNEAHYLSVFDREKTPLEKIFSGKKLFLTAPLGGGPGTKDLNAAMALETSGITAAVSGMKPEDDAVSRTLGNDHRVTRVTQEGSVKIAEAGMFEFHVGPNEAAIERPFLSRTIKSIAAGTLFTKTFVNVPREVWQYSRSWIRDIAEDRTAATLIISAGAVSAFVLLFPLVHHASSVFEAGLFVGAGIVTGVGLTDTVVTGSLVKDPNGSGGDALTIENLYLNKSIDPIVLQMRPFHLWEILGFSLIHKEIWIPGDKYPTDVFLAQDEFSLLTYNQISGMVVATIVPPQSGNKFSILIHKGSSIEAEELMGGYLIHLLNERRVIEAREGKGQVYYLPRSKTPTEKILGQVLDFPIHNLVLSPRASVFLQNAFPTSFVTLTLKDIVYLNPSAFADIPDPENKAIAELQREIAATLYDGLLNNLSAGDLSREKKEFDRPFASLPISVLNPSSNMNNTSLREARIKFLGQVARPFKKVSFRRRVIIQALHQQYYQTRMFARALFHKLQLPPYPFIHLREENFKLVHPVADVMKKITNSPHTKALVVLLALGVFFGFSPSLPARSFIDTVFQPGSELIQQTSSFFSHWETSLGTMLGGVLNTADFKFDNLPYVFASALPVAVLSERVVDALEFATRYVRLAVGRLHPYSYLTFTKNVAFATDVFEKINAKEKGEFGGAKKSLSNLIKAELLIIFPGRRVASLETEDASKILFSIEPSERKRKFQLANISINFSLVGMSFDLAVQMADKKDSVEIASYLIKSLDSRAGAQPGFRLLTQRLPNRGKYEAGPAEFFAWLQMNLHGETVPIGFEQDYTLKPRSNIRSYHEGDPLVAIEALRIKLTQTNMISDPYEMEFKDVLIDGNGRIFALSANNLFVWTPGKSKPIRFQSPEMMFQSFDVSPDGRLVALAYRSHETVLLLDAANLHELHALSTDRHGLVELIEFSTDGKFLSAQIKLRQLSFQRTGGGILTWSLAPGFRFHHPWTWYHSLAKVMPILLAGIFVGSMVFLVISLIIPYFQISDAVPRVASGLDVLGAALIGGAMARRETTPAKEEQENFTYQSISFENPLSIEFVEKIEKEGPVKKAVFAQKYIEDVLRHAFENDLPVHQGKRKPRKFKISSRNHSSLRVDIQSEAGERLGEVELVIHINPNIWTLTIIARAYGKGSSEFLVSSFFELFKVTSYGPIIHPDTRLDIRPQPIKTKEIRGILDYSEDSFNEDSGESMSQLETKIILLSKATDWNKLNNAIQEYKSVDRYIETMLSRYAQFRNEENREMQLGVLVEEHQYVSKDNSIWIPTFGIGYVQITIQFDPRKKALSARLVGPSSLLDGEDITNRILNLFSGVFVVTKGKTTGSTNPVRLSHAKFFRWITAGFAGFVFLAKPVFLFGGTGALKDVVPQAENPFLLFGFIEGWPWLVGGLVILGIIIVIRIFMDQNNMRALLLGFFGSQLATSWAASQELSTFLAPEDPDANWKIIRNLGFVLFGTIILVRSGQAIYSHWKEKSKKNSAIDRDYSKKDPPDSPDLPSSSGRSSSEASQGNSPNNLAERVGLDAVRMNKALGKEQDLAVLIQAAPQVEGLIANSKVSEASVQSSLAMLRKIPNTSVNQKRRLGIIVSLLLAVQVMNGLATPVKAGPTPTLINQMVSVGEGKSMAQDFESIESSLANTNPQTVLYILVDGISPIARANYRAKLENHFGARAAMAVFVTLEDGVVNYRDILLQAKNRLPAQAALNKQAGVQIQIQSVNIGRFFADDDLLPMVMIMTRMINHTSALVPLSIFLEAEKAAWLAA